MNVYLVDEKNSPLSGKKVIFSYENVCTQGSVWLNVQIGEQKSVNLISNHKKYMD